MQHVLFTSNDCFQGIRLIGERCIEKVQVKMFEIILNVANICDVFRI